MSKIYTNILKSTIIPLGDRLMGTNISYYIKNISNMNNWSKDKIENWQNDLLRKLVDHAYNNTDYYKELFNNNGIKPGDIQTINDLKYIPILTKNDIRKNYSSLVSKNITSLKHKKTSTGGSTGMPLVYLLDNRSWSFSNANTIINWEKTGYRYGDKYIALGSSSLFPEKKKSIKHKIYYKFKNKIGLNGINMSDETCEKYIAYINNNNIKYIYGYASSIFLLAKYVFENKINVNIMAVFSTSEILTKVYRETIEKAFNCEIVNCYGAHDGGLTAFKYKNSVFEVSYNCLINPAYNKENSISPIIITDLMNYAMPFINYKLGDEVAIESQTDSFNGQTIKEVLGRTSDIIKLENGKIITGPAFTVLFAKIPVNYYCIKKNGPNSILCLIKKDPDFNKKHEELILQTFRKHLGDEITVEIRNTDKYEYTKSGKVKYFG